MTCSKFSERRLGTFHNFHFSIERNVTRCKIRKDRNDFATEGNWIQSVEILVVLKCIKLSFKTFGCSLIFIRIRWIQSEQFNDKIDFWYLVCDYTLIVVVFFFKFLFDILFVLQIWNDFTHENRYKMLLSEPEKSKLSRNLPCHQQTFRIQNSNRLRNRFGTFMRTSWRKNWKWMNWTL